MNFDEMGWGEELAVEIISFGTGFYRSDGTTSWTRIMCMLLQGFKAHDLPGRFVNPEYSSSGQNIEG